MSDEMRLLAKAGVVWCLLSPFLFAYYGPKVSRAAGEPEGPVEWGFLGLLYGPLTVLVVGAMGTGVWFLFT